MPPENGASAGASPASRASTPRGSLEPSGPHPVSGRDAPASATGASRRGPDAEPPDARRRYAVEEPNVAALRSLGRPRSVLDVGCGVGQNGALLRRRGARVVGLEPDPAALERAREALDEVHQVDVTDEASVRAALGSETFDVVLFADVLEHLTDPLSALKRLSAHLADDGHVVLSLPNVAAWTVRLGLLAGRFEYEPSGILDETHLRFFTLESARRLCEEAGLEVLSHDQNPMLVRALKPLVMKTLVTEGAAPLTSSPVYRAYQTFVRPLEDSLAKRAPELFAFQHVLVARKPPRPRKLTLTVGMLTMNERESIAPMIAEIRRHAPDADILCVDSSTDDTPELARKLGARVLRQLPPRGHGPAMELLMKTAAQTSEVLVYLDCDFTYPADRIPALRALVESGEADVVNCTRTRHRQEAMPLSHWLANRGFAALAHGLHGVPTTDVHSGMRAYRTSVIRRIDFDGEGDALPIDTLLYPAKLGYRVVEAPIPYNERVGFSKLRKVAGTVWTLVRLARASGVGARGRGRFEVRSQLEPLATRAG
jgi:2-polyprenyl-3-methyl-5-hydroxy-6-metoxy-1,4-benzoquinol methylase